MAKQGSVIDVQERDREQDIERQQAVAVREPQAVERADVSMFERMASDPSVDVAKLEKLMELHERALARTAQEQFNAAMARAQAKMRSIAADAENKQTNSKYASYAAMDKALRPIYSEEGLALSFNTGDAPVQDSLRVLCDVTHIGGHCKTYRIDLPADGKGAKGGDVMTRTHATGAAATYGMRYLLKMIFNVAVGEDDTDGNEPPQRPAAPSGFASWMLDLDAVTAEGVEKFDAAWKASKSEFKDYATKYGLDKLKELRNKAKAVKA